MVLFPVIKSKMANGCHFEKLFLYSYLHLCNTSYRTIHFMFDYDAGFSRGRGGSNLTISDLLKCKMAVGGHVQKFKWPYLSNASCD